MDKIITTFSIPLVGAGFVWLGHMAHVPGMILLGAGVLAMTMVVSGLVTLLAK